MSEMFGRYRIDSLLGEGGMGEVFAAFDTRNERTVALKRLRPGTANSEEYRARFQREARAAAGLGSPHVVPIHDVGEIDGRLYIDMRLIRGRDAARVISDTGPLTPARVAVIVTQVADALDSAHQAGLIHRDVKPSNVLLADAGSADFAYLVDFGVAKSVDGSGPSLTGTGVALGTMAYMAPELFLSSAADHRVDVYALACMAHEALTGTQPFTGTGPALMYHHLSVRPPPASSVRPGLPAAVDEVLLRGMAKEPAARYGSAPEFAAALTTALTGRSGETATTGSATEQASGPAGFVHGPTPPPTMSGPSWSADAGQQNRYAAYGAVGPQPYPGGYGTPSGGYGSAHAGPSAYGSGPAGVNHPSGPHGGWYPPYQPGGPATGPARRSNTAVIVTIAILATLVVGFGTLVGIGLVRNEDQPPAGPVGPVGPASGDVSIRNATSDLSLIRKVYTIGPTCTQGATGNPGQVPLASLVCSDPANRATIYYEIWPDAAAAQAHLTNYSNGRASTGGTFWTIEGKQQGPYWLGNSADGQVVSIAVYEGKRFTQFTVAPTGAQVEKSFADSSALEVANVPN